MNTNNNIRGHICKGLKEYQEFSTYGCIPSFSKEGFTKGCDDTNYVPILFCPFCGDKLPEPKRYKFKCEDCNKEWISYKEDEYECTDDDCCGYAYENIEEI